MNQITVLGKREGKHARDKSPHAEASLHFSKKKKWGGVTALDTLVYAASIRKNAPV